MSELGPDAVIVSVPWPVRLFGDFQYFLGLPAMALALDMRTAMGASPRDDGRISIAAPWLKQSPTIELSDLINGEGGVPALSRVLRALQPEGIEFRQGYHVQILTRVPWSDALPDSAALTVASTVLLLALEQRLEKFSGAEVAALAARAFEAEEPSARPVPEIHTAAIGGTLYLKPGAEAAAIERKLPGLVCAWSGTTDKDGGRRHRAAAQTLEAFAVLVKRMPAFKLSETPIDEVIPILRDLPAAESSVVYAHLMCRDFCTAAREIIESETGFDDDRFGELLDNQHEMLHDYMGYIMPEAQPLVEAALGVGAIGVRVIPDSGAVLVFAPGREKDVLSALRDAGGEAHPVLIDDGMRMEKLRGDSQAP